MIDGSVRLDHANLSPVHWTGAANTEVSLLVGWRWDDWALWDKNAEVDKPGCGVEFAVDGVDLEWICRV
jgi:hypothetical protein